MDKKNLNNFNKDFELMKCSNIFTDHSCFKTGSNFAIEKCPDNVWNKYMSCIENIKNYKQKEYLANSFTHIDADE